MFGLSIKINMDDLIVNYKDFYWPKNDGDGVTDTYAGPNTCCHYLSVIYPNVPTEISQYVPNKRVVVQAGGNAGFYIKKICRIISNGIYV